MDKSKRLDGQMHSHCLACCLEIQQKNNLSKYTSHIVEIIYQGAYGQITQRRIEVQAIVGGILKAYCLQRKAPRVFRIENILAVQPVRQGARTS
jgi:hypothetical protein